EIIAYKDAMKSANTKRENEYKRLVSVLENGKSISESDRLKYLREQSLALAEVNFLSEKLEDYIASSNLRKVDIENPYYKLTRAEIQRDVSLKEQQNVQKKNDELIQLSLDIKEAQNKLLDKVEVLAKDGLKDVESVLKNLDRSFAQIDLRSRERLLQQASKLEEGFGGPFIPIEKTKLQDDELDGRYTIVNKQVDRWDGLLKVKSILPIGYPSQHKYITSNFGEREDPFVKTLAMHRGIDFKGTVGVPLFTTAPGKVIRAHTAADYGMFVEVDHGMGFTTLYAHMSKILVSVGDQLNTGDKVGLAGSTGRSTGPHLHYEVRYKKRPINPYSFVVANEN
ncbi:MAG: peptidoglycan DD-metalloendopeptidase family protein, partial [Rickettsiales bacterium]|nr:peptidoglycan DD-metalloendopeptidase family protein [Rickettsiales bacterium]